MTSRTLGSFFDPSVVITDVFFWLCGPEVLAQLMQFY